ncbi:SOS response-associated peptidase [Patescibacteria group bacterium]|nr:SOS response-associated peptidase [Patescibacteria group bacterium]MBU1028784.1 SOS response-associated peptidase [Patescibacteria group bacterium]MBU1916178.1 SOS response-associated peptidase [Patescibacteria group bacterium]
MRLATKVPNLIALKQRFAIKNRVPIPAEEIFPGSWQPVLRDTLSGQAEMFRWGISEPKLGGNNRLVFAVKIENLLTDRGRHLLQQRLIVPVESFNVQYEGQIWQLRSVDFSPVALAAIWDVDGHWRGRPVHAFRIITGPTIDGFECLGPRMPIVLQPEKERSWLWHFTEEAAALDALEPNTALQIEINR